MQETHPAPADRVLREALQRVGYLADNDLATTVWLASELQRPLLLEGDAGVGKTALAGALAKTLGVELVRLQCYEGLDMAQAAYEWNYGRQLMALSSGRSSRKSRLKTSDSRTPFGWPSCSRMAMSWRP